MALDTHVPYHGQHLPGLRHHSEAYFIYPINKSLHALHVPSKVPVLWEVRKAEVKQVASAIIEKHPTEATVLEYVLALASLCVVGYIVYKLASAVATYRKLMQGGGWRKKDDAVAAAVDEQRSGGAEGVVVFPPPFRAGGGGRPLSPARASSSTDADSERPPGSSGGGSAEGDDGDRLPFTPTVQVSLITSGGVAV